MLLWSVVGLALFAIFLPGMGVPGRVIFGVYVTGIVLALLTYVFAALNPRRPGRR